ncbi:MAG: hypothetical protein U9N82_13455 [Thermodesulfobacteriota bacterium]|nr:hypothetical protein [Thermodesulfobacteriota bacterium]
MERWRFVVQVRHAEFQGIEYSKFFVGILLTELAGRLEISVPGAGYSVERGEIIAIENGYRLIE